MAEDMQEGREGAEWKERTCVSSLEAEFTHDDTPVRCSHPHDEYSQMRSIEVESGLHVIECYLYEAQSIQMSLLACTPSLPASHVDFC